MSISAQRIFSDLVRDFLSLGTPLVFTARGRSMAPFILDGDPVLVRPRNSELRVGDVILMRTGGHQFLLHRIIKKGAEGVVTRGDACSSVDDMCPYEDILGKAVKIAGRRIDFHLFFPFGYVLLIALRLRNHPGLFRLLRTIIRKVPPGAFRLKDYSDSRGVNPYLPSCTRKK
jgi:signal peptidase I